MKRISVDGWIWITVAVLVIGLGVFVCCEMHRPLADVISTKRV